MKKDIFKSVMLALCMLVSFYANAHDFEVDGIYYNILTTTEVKVTFKGSYSSEFSEYKGKVEIPESISYDGSTYSVTSIGFSAFESCKGLTSITIPNSVTSIRFSAFYGCTGLTSITIPNSVTSIESGAFYGCTGLTSITIPNSVTSISSLAFRRCTGLASITVDAGNAVYDSRENCNAIIEKETNSLIFGCKNTVIPNSVTSIGDYAFFSCTGLASVTIPNSVTRIGGHAFYGCTGLTSITIPNSVTSIGEYAFYGCTGLTSITIPNSVTSIGGQAFYGCTGLTSITIPNSVTSIGNYAFYGCTGLTSVTIPNSVTSIGYDAFSGCTGLTSITIPNSVTSIGDLAFYGCTGLKIVINISSLNISAGSDGHGYVAYYADKVITADEQIGDFIFKDMELVAYTGNDKEVKLPNNYNGGNYTIGDEAFSGCTGLASITIPNSVTSIGDSAFRNCTGLTSVTIPNSVTSIGTWAFEGCTGLTSINIPNSVTSTGGYAFEGCTGLTSITIPNSVTSIGTGAFLGCTKLKTVINCSSLDISAGSWNHGYVAYYADKVITDGEQIGDFIFKDMELVAYTGNDKEVKLPNNYKGGNYTIGEFAFKGCIGLTSITIPNSVTSIGTWAFKGCIGLTCITIPNSVTSIGTWAFEGCTGLTSINIPNSVTSTGGYAFEGCTGLTSITIPNSVTSIGTGAFKGCTGLTSITIPNSVTSIGYSAFSGCTGLTSITIPNSVTSIGDYAFYDCTSLASITVDDGNAVYDSRENCNAIIEKETNSLILGCKNTTIPNSVTSIGTWAFRGCTGLTSITIPNSVTSIARSAFYGCTGLTSITIPNSVSSIGDYAFYDCISLSEIYSYMENPCACPSNSDGSPTLYVPAGTADKYIAQGWDEWASEIVEVKIEMSNTLAVSDVKVTHGASVILPVSMENEESVTAFQFEVSLPEGVSLVGCELTDRKSDQMLSFSELPNGNYQVAALSLTSKAFKDSEGALVNLQLATEKEMEAGEYNVTVKNIELTTTDEDALRPADCTAKLTVTDVMVGDSNGDGKISITDAVAIVNYILNKPSSNFAVEAADVNMDAKVTITDAVAIVNKILAGTTEAKSRAADMQLDPQ